MQWSVIEPGGRGHQDAEGGRTFSMWDVKQAIYEWRAHPCLFRRIWRNTTARCRTGH